MSTDEPREDENGEGAGEGVGTPTAYQRAQARLLVDGVTFGRVVDRLREARGWSVNKLSAKSGVPLTTVAKLLRGETPQPRAEITCALAYTFGFGNPGALLGNPDARGAARESQPTPLFGVTGGPGPMSLDKLIEALLRGVWAAQGSRQGTPAEGGEREAPETAAAPPAFDPAAEPGVLLPRRALGGIALYVNLLVLVDPRAGG